MNLLPIIGRELRCAARRAPTYYSRLLPAGGLLVTAYIVYSSMSGWFPDPSRLGRYMFQMLHAVLFSLIWVVVPLATADVISRERREDTLGLLLLTPLRAFEVVVAKLMSSLLASMALVVAAVPVIVLPVLIGGVTAVDMVMVVLINLSALIGAVTAGIIASSLSVRQGRAWIASLFVAASWGTVIFALHIWILAAAYVWVSNDYGLWEQFWEMPELLVLMAPVIAWLGAVAGTEIVDFSRAGYSWLPAGVAGGTLLFSLCMAWVGIRFAAWRVVRVVGGVPPSPAQSAAGKRLTREVIFTKQLRRRRSRQLDRSPIAWQQGRRWDARLAKWGWLLLTTGALTLASFDQDWGFLDTMLTTIMWMAVFLLISQLLVSVISLHSERDTGALELLLVTTLTPETFVRGRISAIRWAFIPAAGLMVCCWVFAGYSQMEVVSFRPWGGGWLPLEFIVCGSISFGLLVMALPSIGLCCSLSRPGVISGAFNAAFFSVILPWLGPPAFYGIGYMLHYELFRTAQLRVWPLWIELLIWPGLTGLLQLGFWLSVRRGMLEGYPRILPDWFRRWRLGWLLPWLIPGAVMLWLRLGGMGWLNMTQRQPFVFFLVWQAAAWIVLIFLARGCRSGLVRQLDERSFIRSE